MRPRIPMSACPANVFILIEHCWDENPLLRPTFAKIRGGLSRLFGRAGENIVDHLIKSMERQTLALETDVAEKLQQFMDEKQRSDDILSQILPK